MPEKRITVFKPMFIEKVYTICVNHPMLTLRILDLHFQKAKSARHWEENRQSGRVYLHA